MAESPHPHSSTAPPIRKFAVQHVETTRRSERARRGKDKEHDSASPVKGRGLLESQPDDTSTENSDKQVEQGSQTSSNEAVRAATNPYKEEGNGATSSHRFAPQLIETTKRTRKKGESIPTLKHTDKTDLSPGDRIHLPRHMRLTRPSALPRAPNNTPMQSSDQIPQLKESRFSSSNLNKANYRKTSFRIPHLEPILAQSEGEESNDSNIPSLSTTPSALSDEIEVQRRASREAYKEGFSGYVLELAAKAAKKQLKEQAFAAYPNENEHEPVDHFAVDRDPDGPLNGYSYDIPRDSEATEHLTRRESSVGWSLEELQRHKEMLEEQRRRQKSAEPAPDEAPLMVDPFREPLAWKAAQEAYAKEPPKATIAGSVQEAGELSKMRSAASPPMLGHDIEFRSCISPQHTVIDPTQKPISRAEGSISRQHSGLWTPPGGATPNLTRKSSFSGLWHGVCNVTSNHCLTIPTSMQTGLLTPAIESDDPFLSPLMGDKQQLPSSPTSATVAGIDGILSVEASIELEYPDSLVTQIYNYLSLGYPTLARKYDEELGKISKMTLEDIRKDDDRTNSKGYIGAPEGEGVTEKEAREHCGRWTALRLYIREWARQQPRMIAAESDNWGARARRGSWAI